MLGGALGLFQIVGSYDRLGESTLSLIIFGAALVTCGLSILAGSLLIRGDRDGRTLSVVIQALQVAQFSFGWCHYELMIGPRVQVGYLTAGRFWAVVALNPSVTLRLGGWTPPYAAVNLFAFAAFMYLIGLDDPDGSALQQT